MKSEGIVFPLCTLWKVLCVLCGKKCITTKSTEMSTMFTKFSCMLRKVTDLISNFLKSSRCYIRCLTYKGAGRLKDGTLCSAVAVGCTLRLYLVYSPPHRYIAAPETQLIDICSSLLGWFCLLINMYYTRQACLCRGYFKNINAWRVILSVYSQRQVLRGATLE